MSIKGELVVMGSVTVCIGMTIQSQRRLSDSQKLNVGTVMPTFECETHPAES
jgi:hypothetical protein